MKGPVVVSDRYGSRLGSPLMPGDIIRRFKANGEVRDELHVEGYTSHGKVRLRRPSGTTFTAWWSTWLPKRHTRIRKQRP